MMQKQKIKIDQNYLSHVTWEHWKKPPKGATKTNSINPLGAWLDKSNNF